MKAHATGLSGSVWRVRLEPDEEGGDVTVTAAGMEQLRAAEESTACRALVLEATGDSFCRGMDLEGVARAGDAGAEEPSLGVALYAECLSALRDCRKCVIAVVDGAALGGGVGLAAAADVVVATERAVFGLPEVMVGLIPAMVLPVLMERVGVQTARRLAMGAASISARRAYELGLCDELCEDATKVDKVLRRLLKNVLRVEPGAVAEGKSCTSKIANRSCREGIEAGRAHTTESLTRDRTLAGIRAFVAGESLPWQERYRPPGGE